MDKALTLKELHEIIDPVIELVVAKNTDYGGSMFEEGLKGIYVRMRDKMARLKRLVWENAEPQVKEETVADVFKDFIGYAAGALVYMAREKEAPQIAAVAQGVPDATLTTLVHLVDHTIADLEKAKALSGDNAHIGDAANRLNIMLRKLTND